jgi:hypothetical protein
MSERKKKKKKEKIFFGDAPKFLRSAEILKADSGNGETM